MRTLCLGLALAGCACAAELKYAVIVTRHGVRSPTWTPSRLSRYSASPWPDFGAAPGNLTAHGRALMKIMGGFYRDLFSSQGLLGKPNCSDASRAYFWADTDQRTLETARALAEGILPGCKAEVHSLPEGRNDPLFDPMEAGLAKQDPKLGLAAVAGRIGPQLDALIDAHRPAFDVLTQVLSGSGKASQSIFDEPMSLTAGEAGVTMSALCAWLRPSLRISCWSTPTASVATSWVGDDSMSRSCARSWRCTPPTRI